ncbi:MAG: NFACT RNA binding domain-containing protein [Candidatus Micrarchaeia archaeon]
MEIEIDFTKSPQENAGNYYSRAKKLEQKIEGIEKTIAELQSRLESVPQLQAEEGKKTPTLKQQKKWYEKFHWFFAEGNLLAVGGRDAQQNELLNSRYFESSDLFFHADIFGASVVILKEGLHSSAEARFEVAQFAASYSSAWKSGMTSVDVYAMRRDQVSKSTGKGSLGTGSFLLSGEREWFRNISLGLAAVVAGEPASLNILPEAATKRYASAAHFGRILLIKPGNLKKSEAAKKISKLLGLNDIDEIIRQLPAGEFSVSDWNTES